MKIKKFISKTNFNDLRDQKVALLETINLLEATGNENSISLSEKLDGLLSFIDCFQDMCVDEYGVTKNEAFLSSAD